MESSTCSREAADFRQVRLPTENPFTFASETRDKRLGWEAQGTPKYSGNSHPGFR